MAIDVEVKTKTMLIDTDVHEGFPGVDALLPFLADPWRHHLTDPGWTWRGSSIDMIRYLFPLALRCPWHGYEFDVDTGRCPADPERLRVRTYEATVEDGSVFVEV